ncbi:MAG TPA: hypothetical protein VFM71_13625 [Gemmatimonadaceae bacterium]|nr:hypothetical protein [Gemmatimonadaceae bacterium]
MRARCPHRLSGLFVSAMLIVVACKQEAVPPSVPQVEFLIAAADSTYWVRSDSSGIRVRGAPIAVAEVDGRFVEIYVTDEDRSFYDAVYVGQRLLKRDLITGDSASLFVDTLMPVLARAYAAANPDERPLGPDEAGYDNPRTIATAEVIVLNVHGPFLSYEYRTDIDIIGGPSTHGARRGVIDLRTGGEISLEALFGRETARAATALGRSRWNAIHDSLAAMADGAAAEVRAELDHLSFDPRSFTIGVEDRRPFVRFSIAQSAGRNAGPSYELAAIPIEPPAWWAGVSGAYPLRETRGERTWPRDDFTLVARAAVPRRGRSSFVLRDAAGAEWRLGSVPAPVLRVLWLSDSLPAGTRVALTRAFNESAFYSGDVRIVKSTGDSIPVLALGSTR